MSGLSRFDKVTAVPLQVSVALSHVMLSLLPASQLGVSKGLEQGLDTAALRRYRFTTVNIFCFIIFSFVKQRSVMKHLDVIPTANVISDMVHIVQKSLSIFNHCYTFSIQGSSVQREVVTNLCISWVSDVDFFPWLQGS